MSKITIYQEEKTNLLPVSFLNDIQNQTKIRDIDVESDEFRGKIGILFTKVNNLLGIKQQIIDINKTDIREMIAMRFNGLSLNELDYAFKLERFGEFGTRIEHFQLFNAEYVGKVIERYLEWKEFKKRTYNIKKELKLESISESEKNKITNEGVLKAYYYFKENRVADKSRIYIYDVLDGMDLMPKDNETKNKVKKDAVYLLNQEYSNKKSSSLEERRQINRDIEKIKNPKDSLIILKCKELSLEDYFRGIRTEKQEQEFLEKFKTK